MMNGSRGLDLNHTHTAPAGGRQRTEHLFIEEVGVNVTGRPSEAIAVNGSIPAPLLRWREGDDVTVQVTNRLCEPTSIHWHGLLVAASMDGVPDVSAPAIQPGETFSYHFRLAQSGTYWYHSHSGGQWSRGFYGPIIIEPDPSVPDLYTADRDYTVMLADWSDETPEQVFALLQARGTADVDLNVGRTGEKPNDEMSADATHAELMRAELGEVKGYTFLMNGKTSLDNWIALFGTREKVRLRFINAAAMTYFDVRIPQLSMQVIQADGQDVEPTRVDQFRFGPGETYDVLVEPEAGAAYTVFAQALDRSGYVRGTLVERAGASAPVPPMDPPPLSAATSQPGPDAGGDAWRDPSGRRVLQYSDLRAHRPNRDAESVGPPSAVVVLSPTGPPSTEVVLRLTGGMQPYVWSVEGPDGPRTEPVRITAGERVRLRIINETMMGHPMHFHGVFMELQNGRPAEFAPRKHTIAVPPHETVVADIVFGEAGPWAFHCHLLFHVLAGMITVVQVAPSLTPAEQ